MLGPEDVKRVVDSAVESAIGRLKDELATNIARDLPQPEPAPAPAAAPAAGGVDAVGIRGSVFQLFDGNGQVEILNHLMEEIVKHWRRSVLYLVKGPQFQPWDVRGYEDAEGGNAGVKAKPIASDADTLLAASLTGSGAQADDARLTEALGAPVGARAAVPLGIRNKPAAVLYCEGPLADEDTAVAVLEILARCTAASIELSMLTKRTESAVRSDAVRGVGAAAAAAAAAAASASAPEPDFAFGGPEPAVEAEPAAEEPAVAAEPAPSFEALAQPAPAPEPAAPEPPAPEPAAPEPPAPEPATPEAPAAEAPAPAAQLLKGTGTKPVVDAGQPAQASPGKFSRWTPVRAQMQSPVQEDASLASIPESERPKHVEAKKLARLLVTEIKLYHEAKVAVGRKNKDLYERLKDDIERSRKTYLDRVDPSIAQGSTDYFRDELVATLAEGDAEALGMGG